MGTNKIHLYQYLIAKSKGQNIDFRDFEKVRDPETLKFATKVFDRYEDFREASLVVNCLGDPDGETCEVLADRAGVRPGTWITTEELDRL
jgi:hypothetical protein